MSGASPRPWKVHVETPGGQQSVKILDARGGVVALMKAGGGRKVENAMLLVDAVNAYQGEGA